MKNDNLDSLSYHDLDEVFAVEVAGYTRHQGLMHAEFSKGEKWHVNAPGFCADADLTLPWLMRHRWEARYLGGRTVFVSIDDKMLGEAKAFLPAVCIALIRAARQATP